MPLAHLHAILACGDRLAAALEACELDRVATLTAEREALVAALAETEAPRPLPPDWAEAAEALAHQHRALTALGEAQARSLDEALAQAVQQRRAQRSYDGPAAQTGRLRPTYG